MVVATTFFYSVNYSKIHVLLCFVLNGVCHRIVVHDEATTDIGYKRLFDRKTHFFVGFDGVCVVLIYEKSDAGQIIILCELDDFCEELFADSLFVIGRVDVQLA